MPPCPWVTITRNRRLTGKVKFAECRVGWRKTSVVLMVEECIDENTFQFQPDKTKWKQRYSWRPASCMDMASPVLRWIIDGQGEAA